MKLHPMFSGLQFILRHFLIGGFLSTESQEMVTGGALFTSLHTINAYQCSICGKTRMGSVMFARQREIIFTFS